MSLNMRSAGLAMTFVLAFAWNAHGKSIFVNKNSPVAFEDGSAIAPFRTITRGLELARKIRFGFPAQGIAPSTEIITIIVAPSPTPYVGSFDLAVFDPANPSYDPTKERLPLLLNVPRLKLLGGTHLLPSGDGLPLGVVQGTQTIIRSDRPQTQKQYMIMVTRTVPLASSGFPVSQEMAGDDVTITGFWLQAEAARQLPSALIGFDGVSDFVVRANVLVDSGNGVWTRLSSGTIEGNLSINNTVGFFLTGGSHRFPANLKVTGNRANGNATTVAGLGVLGAGETGNRRKDLDFGGNKQLFMRIPLPDTFSRTLDPDGVPDSISALVIGNDFSGHSQNGIRSTGYLQDPYNSPPGEDEVANVTATFVGNVTRSNAHYGLTVDAGQIALGDRRIVNMALSFTGNTSEGNGLGPAIFSLWRYAGSASIGTSMPFSQPSPTFAHDSRIEACGDVTRFHYDNRQNPDPPTNPVPTNNRLIVNNVELTGLCVGNCIFEVPVSVPACAQRR